MTDVPHRRMVRSGHARGTRSIRRRVAAGIAVLLVIFVALVGVQLVVGERLQRTRLDNAERLSQARQANRDILQSMTDAETAVRGFQLTGEPAFLTPYESGRVAAFTAFDRVASLSDDPEVLRLLAEERRVVSQWMDTYAIPIVTSGVADRDQARAAQGREWFDAVRAANAGVDAAIRAEELAVAEADGERAWLVHALLAGLAFAFIATTLVLAAIHQRNQLAPLEHILRTLERLAAGDRSARAVPAGSRELRAVIGTLNELAAETERLLADEHLRARRSELRQTIAAELRTDDAPAVIATRVAEHLAVTFEAAEVHGRVAIGQDEAIAAHWPSPGAAIPGAAGAGSGGAGIGAAADVEAVAGSEALLAAAEAAAAGRSGAVVDVPGVAGAVAVVIAGDAECPAGIVSLRRPDRPVWTTEEREQLVAVVREVEHAARQQRLQDRQVRLIRELRALDERKDDFVATVTHELRTPLTSILGYAEILTEDDGLSPAQRRGLEAILRNAVRLHTTVADLLSLDPAVQRGRSDAPVDLAAVASSVAADVRAAARAKGVRLTVEAGPAWVHGDAEHLGRAVRHLLDNAVKFTAAGGEITCRVTGDGPTAELEVTDTGIGIPPADQPGMFTPFHRGANAMDQAVQGSGLGLAIVRTIVTEHGGAVSVRSALGSGSTFTITLPAMVPAASIH